MDSQRLLEASARIGRRLVGAATWVGDECTWPVVVPDVPTRRATGLRYELAKGEFYQGTAGIGLFLAELGAVLGEPVILRCAEGALRHSIRWASASRVQLGFHSGTTGVAYVAARFAKLTSNGEWADGAVELIRSTEPDVLADTNLDIIGGVAGASLATLRVREMLDLPDGLELACAMGRHAAARAARRASGWSWPTGGAARQDLCGYAHGASGFAHAFLELFAATDDARWMFAALRAIAYERPRVIQPGGDWPDYRCIDATEALRSEASRNELRRRLRTGTSGPEWHNHSMRAWCHGSPGIVLSRLRAIHLGVDVTACRAEIIESLAAISSDIASGRPTNFSLCHGVFGNMEALVLADDYCGIPIPVVIESTLDELVDRHDTDHSWPSGAVGDAPDPSLMLGDAGVGHSLLRLANRSVPSALFLSSWSEGNSKGLSFPTALLEEEVASMLPTLGPILRRVPAAAGLSEELAIVVEGAISTAEVVDWLESRLNSASAGSVEALMYDGILPDLARLRMDRAAEDYLELLYRRFAAPDVTAIDWDTIRVVLSPHVEIVTTSHSWRSWLVAEGDFPIAQPEHFLVSMSIREAFLNQITPLVVMVLQTMREPSTLASIVQRVLPNIDCDPSEIETIEAAVLTTVRRAVYTNMAQVVSR